MQVQLKSIDDCSVFLPRKATEEQVSVLQIETWPGDDVTRFLSKITCKESDWLYLLVDLALLENPGLVQLLSMLRDQTTSKFAVFAIQDKTVMSPDLNVKMSLMALGLSGRQQDGLWWCEYDVAHYKPTPDWFGPRNWANPEMWDRYRW